MSSVIARKAWQAIPSLPSRLARLTRAVGWGVADQALSSVTNFAGDFRSLYAHQANLQVEQEIAQDFSVTVGLQYFGGRRMPLLIDVNLGAPIGFLADGRPVFSNANRPHHATTRPNTGSSSPYVRA